MLVLLSLMASEVGCYSQQSSSQNMCFVLDTSLSMATKESLGRRLDIAKKNINEKMDNAPLFSKFALILAGQHPRLVQNWTDDKDVLARCNNSDWGHSC